MDIKPGPLLTNINSPADLKKLGYHELSQLSAELRQYIIDVVSIHGGHFGASLGVVELTVALHYVFNTPYDKLLWDVGHQAYGHKILTGRRDAFLTNRKFRGLSGFPRRSESVYDAFGTGHSSTSISAALGMAIASRYKGETHRQHVAIIGDGAMTAGQAFEAINHAGIEKTNLLVILNDNCMSIDPNVGALKEYLAGLTTSPANNNTRDAFGTVPGAIAANQFLEEMVLKMKASLKGMVSKESNLFESLNFRYFGPVDGHNIASLIDTLSSLKDIAGPKILHVKTVKGKGYASAEKDQTKWHAPGFFDKITGEIYKNDTHLPRPPRYQDVFGHTILELAKKNDRIMGITPAMPSGSSLGFMMEEMPDRAFDVGICEQHAVTLSAGLATQGMRVFCNIYSTFMQRAYDQVIHDVAVQDLPVIFCLDRAGLVGEDGSTHHGAFDIAYMRCIPNMIVSAPMNESELRNLMFTAQMDKMNHPIAIRYPRGQATTSDWMTAMEEVTIGTGRILKEGSDLAVLSLGHIGNIATEAVRNVAREGIRAGHYDMRFAKPLDEALLHKIFQKYSRIITLEDGTVMGGFGSAILEFMNEHNYKAVVKIMGIPDRFIEQGSPRELYEEIGLTAHNITETIREMVNAELSEFLSKD